MKAYFFVIDFTTFGNKSLDKDASNFVILQTTGSVQYARLSPGEFCFFPVNDGNGLEARADTASCVLEYAYWKKG